MAVLEAVAVRVLRIDDGRIGASIGVLLLGSGAMALLSGVASRIGWPRTLGAAGVVIAVGGGAEILGLYSALPFGRYEYTDWWLPYLRLPNGKLFPILMPLTWFLVIATCYLVLARRFRGLALILGTAVLAALVDLALEPVITRVVLLWRWLEPTPLLGAPYQNAVGWLVISGIAAGCLQALELWRARELSHPTWMFSAGLLSTAVIGLTYGEPRGVVALAVLPVALWVRGRV